jgi:GNAT superfamily N-acetyltransferase
MSNDYTPSMPPTLHPSSEHDKEWVFEQLMAFNRTVLPMSREEYVIPLNFHVRDGEKIVAGINACTIAQATAFVAILWVDAAYRGYDYGSYLLTHVESKAREIGARLIHLETFDFQARGFYLKHGYSEFAALEDSPAEGRKRFYLKKIL